MLCIILSPVILFYIDFQHFVYSVYSKNIALSLALLIFLMQTGTWGLPGVYECKRKQLLKPVFLNSWIDLRVTYKVKGAYATFLLLKSY